MAENDKNSRPTGEIVKELGESLKESAAGNFFSAIVVTPAEIKWWLDMGHDLRLSFKNKAYKAGFKKAFWAKTAENAKIWAVSLFGLLLLALLVVLWINSGKLMIAGRSNWFLVVLTIIGHCVLFAGHHATVRNWYPIFEDADAAAFSNASKKTKK